MSPTFVLIPGAGGEPVVVAPGRGRAPAAGLRRRVAVDLPCDDDSAGLDEYVDAALAAIGDRRDHLVVVDHSLGGFTGTLAVRPGARRPTC